MKNIKKAIIFALTFSMAIGSNLLALAQESTFTVTIVKYIDGVHASAANADDASFPMHAVFPGGAGDYALATAGFNNPNAYEATTAAMPAGSDYSTSEILTGDTVAAACDGIHPFALVGYSVGDTLEDAAEATTSMAADLTDLSANEFVIVWNKTCPITPVTGSLTVTKKTTGGNGTFNFTGDNGVAPFQITTLNGTGSTTISDLTPGTTTIAEGSLPTGWSMATSTCANVIVAAGQTASCEIDNTFTEAATSTGNLLVTKKTTGGNGTFNFTGNNGIDPFQITTANGIGTQMIGDLAPGIYTIAEGSLPTGWSMATSACANVNVVADQTATCEIDNMFTEATSTTGSLMVVKKTIGGDGTFKFASDNAGVGNFSITTTSGMGSKTFNNLVPGSYDVDELTPLPLGSGWTETMTTCDGVIVAAGQTATCEIDNTFAPGGGGGQATLKVHILKYLDGVLATAATANNYLFPMTATWSAANIGAGSGKYVLGNNYGGAADLYGADTAAMSSPAAYMTSEITSNIDATSKVLPPDASCKDDRYQLAGYTTGDTLAQAQSATSTAVAPSFAGINSDKYVIVWNKTCKKEQIKRGMISGMKFNDKNRNGIKDAGELGLSGWTIYLDTNNNGALDSGEPSAITGPLGNYQFPGLADGTYHVREVMKAGWVQSAPGGGVYNVTLSAGSRIANGKNFGNYTRIINTWYWNHLGGNGESDNQGLINGHIIQADTHFNWGPQN